MSGLSMPVLFGAGGFMALAVAGVGLLQLDIRNRRLAQKMAVVLQPYAPASARIAARPSRLTRSVVKKGWADRLGRIIGLEANRPELYPVAWWMVPVAMVAVGFAVSQGVIAMLGPTGWLAWPITWLFCTRWLFGRWLDTYHTTLLRQMPDALSMIVRAVRTGMTVTDSFRVVANEAQALTSREFRLLHGELSVGVVIDEALWKLAMRTGLREYRFLAVALALQAQTGGNLTETLENLADVMRKRAALRQRGKALSSEGRATAVVLTALPFLTGTALYLITPDYVMLLFTDPIGKKIFIGLLVLLGAGMFTLRSIISRTLA